MKDPRSTGRRRLRKALFDARIPFICNVCGHGPKQLPMDFPRSLMEEFEFAPVGDRDKSRLEANHINKDWWDNDESNGEWLCPSCHKKKDGQTEKGISVVDSDIADLL